MIRLAIILALAATGQTPFTGQRPFTGPTPFTVGPEGYGPVRIGMTVPQAGAALHTRLRVDRNGADPTGECTYATSTEMRDRNVAFMVGKGRIVRIDVTAPGTTTARGIGVGATIAALKAAYRPLKAGRNAYSDEPEYEWRAPGGRSGLVFETEKGRIADYRGGLDPWLSYIEGCA